MIKMAVKATTGLLEKPIIELVGIVYYKNGHKMDVYNVMDKNVSMFIMDDGIHMYRGKSINNKDLASLQNELSNAGAPASDFYVDKIIIN